MSVQRKRDIARLFMSSAISQLEEKVVLGIQWFEKEVREGREKGVLTSLVCSGGVASNMYLRERYVCLSRAVSRKSSPIPARK